MKLQRSQSQMILWVGGIVLGLAGILGGIAAASARGGQPERYHASAVVMTCSGVLWLVCSFFPKFELTRKQYIIIVWVLGLGLVLGLFSTYMGCENECWCHRQFGYPGRWLQVSNCMGRTPVAVSWRTIRTGWEIDFRSLAADVVFWSGAGLIVAFVWKRIHVETTTGVVKN
jgi:hypothetical protein